MDDDVESLRVIQWAAPSISAALAFFFGETAALILLVAGIAFGLSAVVAAGIMRLRRASSRRTHRRRSRRSADAVPLRTSVREWGEAADVWSKVLLRLSLIGFGIAGGAVVGGTISPS